MILKSFSFLLVWMTLPKYTLEDCLSVNCKGSTDSTRCDVSELNMPLCNPKDIEIPGEELFHSGAQIIMIGACVDETFVNDILRYQTATGWQIQDQYSQKYKITTDKGIEILNYTNNDPTIFKASFIDSCYCYNISTYCDAATEGEVTTQGVLTSQNNETSEKNETTAHAAANIAESSLLMTIFVVVSSIANVSRIMTIKNN